MQLGFVTEQNSRWPFFCLCNAQCVHAIVIILVLFKMHLKIESRWIKSMQRKKKIIHAQSAVINRLHFVHIQKKSDILELILPPVIDRINRKPLIELCYFRWVCAPHQSQMMTARQYLHVCVSINLISRAYFEWRISQVWIGFHSIHIITNILNILILITNSNGCKTNITDKVHMK